MPRTLDIACLQTRPMPDVASAVSEALPMAEAAVTSGAEVLFLPEYCGGLSSDGPTLTPPADAEASHPFLKAMRNFAAEKSVAIQVGSVAVKGPAGKLINRGVMIDTTGQITGRYDKIHMFDVQLSQTEVYSESATIAPGNEAVIYDLPQTRVGHTICYDLRFPHLYRDLSQSGAEILTCPAAFTKKTGAAHWHVLNRARAIENTRFMVSACAIGPIPGGGESYGHSLIINPWGEVLADGGTLPGVVRAQIDLDMVAEVSAKVPSLTHDRAFQPAATPNRKIA